MLALIFIIMTGVGAIVWIISQGFRASRRRKKTVAQPFPTAWRRIIKKRMPYFLSMPTHLQLQLKKHIQIFIEEKEFIGCEGVQITDEIRVTVAAQACLLLLNRNTGYYPNLKQILIYPAAFIIENEQADHTGIVWYKRSVLSGESWSNGKVILSWHDTLTGAANPFDGNNVVIHEFAHQLDQEAGQANGAPLMANAEIYKQWSLVLAREYDQLRHCAANNLPSIFNYYGATNPAEFFAVISEVFFEKSAELHRLHPELYQQLCAFYRLDPINWY